MHDATPIPHPAPLDRAPWFVPRMRPVVATLLRRGVPLGPNVLVTVPGRTSGVSRTTPLAIIEDGGRRWVWSPWGDVNWVRNLRAAGRATITVGGRTEQVAARELDEAERVVFFREVLGGVARRMPGGLLFVRIVDRTDLRRPEEVAQDRRVFELHEPG